MSLGAPRTAGLEARVRPDLRLLAQAALCSGARARAAFEAWRASVDVDRLDLEAMRLLPLLARNLTRLGIADPALGVWKGLARHTWSRNQILRDRLRSELVRLRDAGIPTLVLKGAALLALHYEHGSLRPMEDIDLLVPRADAARALDVLRRGGWRPATEPAERLIGIWHACDMRNAEGLGLDLHWRVLYDDLSDGADEEFWRASVPLEIAGEATRALGPTDQILHACVHALVPRAGTLSVRWAADVTAVLASAGERVEWDRLVEQATRRRLGLRVRLALELLAATLDAPVPSAVLERLARGRPCRLERREMARVGRPLGGLGGGPLLWLAYARLRGSDSGWAWPLGFPPYLKRVWAAPTWRDAGRQAAARLRRRRLAG